MEFVADLHIHSYLSRACSNRLRPEVLHRWCQLKGITVLSTGDFTHPKWFAELREKLVPAEEGLFALKPELAAATDMEVPPSCRAPVRFLLGVEISCIYKKSGKVRKIHNLAYAPSFEAAARINAKLEEIGNIRSDGRPILGLDSKDLLSIVLESSDEAHLIPAHAWTPHFAVFGSESGFDKAFGNELHILRETPVERLRAGGYPLLALALDRVRRGKVDLEPGYDGEYGTIGLLRERDFSRTTIYRSR